jgi:YaiO family outer membrane protein
MVGGSDSDLGIYPEWTLSIGYEYVTPPESGMIYRVGLSYAEFANDTETTTLSGELVRYFPAFSDGSYLVGQLGGRVVASEPGSEMGWDTSGALTYVQPGGWSVGLAAGMGTIDYQPFAAAPVNNNFVSIRPFVSREFAPGQGIILSVEYVDTDTYDISGMSIGLKFDF